MDQLDGNPGGESNEKRNDIPRINSDPNMLYGIGIDRYEAAAKLGLLDTFILTFLEQIHDVNGLGKGLLKSRVLGNPMIGNISEAFKDESLFISAKIVGSATLYPDTSTRYLIPYKFFNNNNATISMEVMVELGNELVIPEAIIFQMEPGNYPEGVALTFAFYRTELDITIERGVVLGNFKIQDQEITCVIENI